MDARLALLIGASLCPMQSEAQGVKQAGHRTPFTGTWKLNVAKSSFDPGPPFKSFTIAFTSDGTRKLDLVDASGRAASVELPWSDGKVVRVAGMENATATSKMEGKKFHDVWMQNGKITEDVVGVLSADARSFTTTVDAMYEQGHPIHNRLTFERQ